jgi:hypothetical protein
LTALERATAGDAEPELVPNQNVEQVNLEHVLPRNPTAADWPAFDEEQRQSMRLMLGNQALLKKNQNRQLGNQPFSAKKPTLAASGLNLTREIGLVADWTPAEIVARQKRMARLAAAVWPKSLN